MAHLAKSQFKDLEILNVSGNKVGLRGAETLSKGNWQSLHSFFICKNGLRIDYNAVHLNELVNVVKCEWP